MNKESTVVSLRALDCRLLNWDRISIQFISNTRYVTANNELTKIPRMAIGNS